MSDELLLITMKYITDFMRQVIENGSPFSKNHLFLMLLHLKVEEIENDSHKFIKPLLTEMKVDIGEY